MYLKQWLTEKKKEARKKGLLFRDSDFAEKLGVSKTTISYWNIGKSMPNRGMAKYLEKLTKGAVTYEDFLRFREEKKAFQKKKEEILEKWNSHPLMTSSVDEAKERRRQIANFESDYVKEMIGNIDEIIKKEVEKESSASITGATLAMAIERIMKEEKECLTKVQEENKSESL